VQHSGLLQPKVKRGFRGWPLAGGSEATLRCNAWHFGQSRQHRVVAICSCPLVRLVSTLPPTVQSCSRRLRTGRGLLRCAGRSSLPAGRVRSTSLASLGWTCRDSPAPNYVDDPAASSRTRQLQQPPLPLHWPSSRFFLCRDTLCVDRNPALCSRLAQRRAPRHANAVLIIVTALAGGPSLRRCIEGPRATSDPPSGGWLVALVVCKLMWAIPSTVDACFWR
jgi:hypothetical protein